VFSTAVSIIVVSSLSLALAPVVVTESLDCAFALVLAWKCMSVGVNEFNGRLWDVKN